MGKIIVDLDVALAKKRVALTELSDQVDISLSSLSTLETSKTEATRFSALSEICRVLSCDVGGPLHYEEGEDDGTNL